MKNKRILIVSAVFYPEPVVSANLSRDIALKLAEKHKVTVVCPRPTRPYGYDFSNQIIEVDNSYKRIELSSYTCAKTNYVGRLRETYSFGRAVQNYLASNHTKYDVIYSWSWPLYAQLLIAKAAKKYKLPLITHIQDVYPEPFLRRIPLVGKLFYKLFFNIDRKSLELSSTVIAIAPKIKEYLVKTRSLSESKIKIVYNWQDESRFEKYTSKERPNSRPFTFMFLGTLSGAANLTYIVNCFLKADIPNSKFVFAGSGTAKEQLLKVANSEKEKQIEFWDAPFTKVAEIQDQADVLVVSLNKGGGAHAFPSKLPAYMFSKKPILASVDFTSDIAYVVNQSNSGWVVEPNQEEELIKTMKTISEVPFEELSIMGDKGFSYAKRHLSKETNLSKICNLIETLDHDKE